MSERNEALLPCPFCGGEIYDAGGGAVWHRDRDALKCCLAGYGYTLEGWNRRALKSRQGDSGWVSVKERLPEENTVVLVFIAGNSVERDCLIRSIHNQIGWKRWANITHWMPLPKPPTEE